MDAPVSPLASIEMRNARITVTILGGPFVTTWRIAPTGDSLSPAYYLMMNEQMLCSAGDLTVIGGIPAHNL